MVFLGVNFSLSLLRASESFFRDNLSHYFFSTKSILLNAQSDFRIFFAHVRDSNCLLQ